MSVVIGVCPTCAGTCTVANPGFPGSYECGYCNGSGVMRKRGYGGYKTATTAAKALANGHGMRCNECDGSGRRHYPESNPCHCDSGQVVIEAHAGDRLPEVIGRTRYIPKDVARALAQELTISVLSEDRPGSWVEAHLGIGSIVSVTDYGRAWEALQADEEAEQVRLIHEARDQLLFTQWSSLVRRDTRQIAERLVVNVHHNGWTLISAATLESAVNQVASLPPTYTADVLTRPVSP